MEIILGLRMSGALRFTRMKSNSRKKVSLFAAISLFPVECHQPSWTIRTFIISIFRLQLQLSPGNRLRTRSHVKSEAKREESQIALHEFGNFTIVLRTLYSRAEPA